MPVIATPVSAPPPPPVHGRLDRLVASLVAVCVFWFLVSVCDRSYVDALEAFALIVAHLALDGATRPLRE